MPVNSDSWIGFVPRQHQIDGPPGGAEGRILTVPRLLPWVPNIGGGCSV
jgi:hypothetical protein